jgi:hypothetical protein
VYQCLLNSIVPNTDYVNNIDEKNLNKNDKPKTENYLAFLHSDINKYKDDYYTMM